MKCWNCKVDVLDLFNFCHACGRSLKWHSEEQNDTSTTSCLPGCRPSGSQRQSISSQGTMPNLSLARSNSTARTTFESRMPPPTFEQFRKRLSASRTDGMKNNKKKQKVEPKEVLINVGIMYLADGNILKPIKGKNMPIQVPVAIRKLELLSKSIDKHADHDRRFQSYGDYALVYPDGTEVLTLPGQPSALFQLDKYKEEVKKPWNRINLYIIDRPTLELYNQDEHFDNLDPEFEESVSVLQTSKHSISLTGTATKTKGINEESNSPKVGVQNSASAEAATQASCQETQEQASDVQEHDKPVNSSSFQFIATSVSQPSSTLVSNSAALKTLKDLFPCREENELSNAIQSSQSLEKAVNFLLHGPNSSVMNTYASLLDGLETDDNEPDEVVSCINSGDLDDQPATYSGNEEIQKKLSDLKTSSLNPSQYFRLKVTRRNVWGDTLFKLSRIKACELNNSLKVQFVGEPAVDQGGPSRELFCLLNHAVQGRLVTNGVFRHDISFLQRREFFAFGQLTAIGLLQGSPGPKFFSENCCGLHTP